MSATDPAPMSLHSVPPPPDVDEFCKSLAPNDPRNRSLLKLLKLLGSMDPEAPLRERLDAIEDTAHWLRERGHVPPVAGSQEHEPLPTSRMRLLVCVLDSVPAWRRAFARVLRTVLWECTGLRLLCMTGLPTEPRLVGAAIDRLVRPILPAPPDDHELDEIVSRMFPTHTDAEWLRHLPSALVARLASALGGARGEGVGIWDPLRRSVADGVALLATRISALGLGYEIRERAPVVPLRESPFFRLPRACDALVAACETDTPAEAEVRAAADACTSLVVACREAVEVVLKNLERYGVSVDVVYTLELITKKLDRLEVLMVLLAPPDGTDVHRVGADLLATLIDGRLHGQSVLALVRDNVSLLARKIIERVGETGEHYITSSRGEYGKMLLSASGGGILTAGTTSLKFLVGWLKFPPFVEGLFSSVNYAGSFLLMQMLGCTLATKQPSATAAALADALHSSDGGDVDEVVTLIARITRSQLAAAIGNIGMVVPSAFALDWYVRRQTGHSFLGFFDEGTSEYVLHSLHPFQSGTIFYAAFTGCLLWLSSVAAGWLENWAVYKRLPEAIAQHRIRRVLGGGVTRWASRVFARNVAGFGGNVTLGVLLGMTAVMAKFFGVPLDVRHVTLSTGALVLAVCDLGGSTLDQPAFRAAAGGIAIIGLLNFGVSFALAFTVALRARQVAWRARLRLGFAIVRRMVRSPLEFVFPPAGAEPFEHPPVVAEERTHRRVAEHAKDAAKDAEGE